MLFLKTALCIVVAAVDIAVIILEMRLPNPNKSTKHNFHSYGFYYNMGFFLNFAIGIASFFLIPENEKFAAPEYFWTILIIFGTVLFALVFMLNLYNMKKRIKPYREEHKKDFRKYRSPIGFTNSPFAQALFFAVGNMAFLMGIFQQN